MAEDFTVSLCGLEEGFEHDIERHNQRVRKELLKQVRSLSPAKFESLVGQLLTVLGFDKVEVTKEYGDGGIDVRGTLAIGVDLFASVWRFRQSDGKPTCKPLLSNKLEEVSELTNKA